jgi:predicted RNase H-like HicB family nuclease
MLAEVHYCFLPFKVLVPANQFIKVLMEKYLIVIEKTATGHSAYSPDVSGCIATGRTIERTTIAMKEALELHLRSMITDKEKIPHPRGAQSYLDALEMSDGSDFIITHIAVSDVTPQNHLQA